jgi:hypothetical protein
VGIPPAPRGVPQIEVSFDIDANGIVNVEAKDLGTGKEQQITITASSGLSEAEIEQMVRDVESHAEEDQRRREEADVRNNADNLVYSIEHSLKAVDDKLDQNTKLEIEEAISEAKETLAGDNIEEVKRKLEALLPTSHKLSEVLSLAVQEVCARYSGKDYYVGGNIPPMKELNARSTMRIPEDQSVVALFDNTVFGSNKDGVAITGDGIYWRNTPGQEPSRMSWSEFASAQIQRSGWLGGNVQVEDKELSLNGCGFDIDQAVALLQEIQLLVGHD